MQPRDRLIDLFSTFAVVEDDRFRCWSVAPRLQRSMQRQIGDVEQSNNDRVWAVYWYRQLDRQPLASEHLTAYLQERCFWIARSMTRRVRSSQYTLADYFQITNSQIPRAIASFQPERSSNFQAYAQLVLTNALKDSLRQSQAADVCSDWSLLRRVSKKRIGDVLVDRGVTEPAAAQYQLAWWCFKTLYIPTETNSQQLSPPEPLMWQQMAELYAINQHQLDSPNIALTPAQIEAWMTKLAKWTRSYLYPQIDSLNRSKPEAGTGEIQDDLTDDRQLSPIDAAIERQEIAARLDRRAELHATLARALTDLSPQLQQILELFYRDGLSQQELSDRCQISQPTVSRRIKQAEEQLLKALLIWLESHMNKFPDPNELKTISTHLKEWLVSHYSSEKS